MSIQDQNNDKPQLVATQGSEGLVAEHLVKRYRNRPILRDVSISVRRGEADQVDDYHQRGNGDEDVSGPTRHSLYVLHRPEVDRAPRFSRAAA